MNIIKLITLIISVLSIFCSCNTHTTKRVRSIEVILNHYNGKYHTIDSSIHILEVDTALKTGDIISSRNSNYKIID